jgi:hypothetical protein
MRIISALTNELIVAGLLIVLLVIFINPSGFWMPNSVHMMLLLLFLVTFLAFAALIWKERPKDEREELHVLVAGRLAFLVGAVLLAAGIIAQGLSHNVDPWLVLTLGGMILTKIFTRIYTLIRK